MKALIYGRNMPVKLLRGGMGSFGVKIASTGIGFAATVVLSRSLGAEGYGTYTFVFSLIVLLAIPAEAGLPPLLVRETAKAEVQRRWGLMRGLWRWGNLYVTLFSLLMLVVGVLVLWLGQRWLSDVRWHTFAVGLILVPLMALGKMRGAALRGLRHIVGGQLPDDVLRPSFFLVLIVLIAALGNDRHIAPENAMALHGVAALLAFAIGAVLLFLVRPDAIKSRPEPEYRRSNWRNAVVPLALLAGLQLINKQTDIVMLGIMRADDEVGVYKVGFSLATLIVFGQQAMNQAIQPHLARLYTQAETEALQRLVTVSARISLFVAIPPVLLLILFGGPILEFLFGNEYRTGATAVAILALGQLVNVGMGPVAILLNMTGHQRDTLKGVAMAAICNLILNFVLIPPYGVNGAAIATAVTLVVWNLTLSRFARRRLMIGTTALGESRDQR